MKEVLRRRLTLAAAAGIVACAGALGVLRFGRPAFYTDGELAMSGSSLAAAPVLVFDPPEPETELPGPVSGRVERLPDGRLIYGLVLEDGTTDLVLFDPTRPGVAPEPAPGLNSPGHDLAPALAGGVLWFASDREGGAGGFDLWSARLLGGSFTAPKLVAEPVNTALDETDPAPDRDGTRLVFVRRDPALLEGRNGVLMIAVVGGSDERVAGAAVSAAGSGVESGGAEPGSPLAPPGAGPRRLFDPTPGVVALDRDPCFSASGGNLWFVRQEDGGPAAVMRSWSHKGEFVAPRVQETLSADGGLRSPRMSADGFTVHLLKPGPPALIYSARGREVFPWWEGQRDLESALVSFMLFCVLLILLLYLGRRWRTLDLVTQCLLLSLLVHILVLLWLGRVQLVRAFTPPPPRESQIEVRLFTADAAADAGQGADAGPRQVQEDVARLLGSFDHEASLAAATPAAELAAAARQSNTPPAPRVAEPVPAVAEMAASLQDEAAPATVRSGVDQAKALEARAAEVVRAREAALAAERTVAASEAVFTVSAPSAEAPPRATRASGAVAPDVREQSLPRPRELLAGTARVADAPAPMPEAGEGARADLAAARVSGPAPSAAASGAVAPADAAVEARPVLAEGSSNHVAAAVPAPDGLPSPERSARETPVPARSAPAPRELAAAARLQDGLENTPGRNELAASRPGVAGVAALTGAGLALDVAAPGAPAPLATALKSDAAPGATAVTSAPEAELARAGRAAPRPSVGANLTPVARERTFAPVVAIADGPAAAEPVAKVVPVPGRGSAPPVALVAAAAVAAAAGTPRAIELAPAEPSPLQVRRGAGPSTDALAAASSLRVPGSFLDKAARSHAPGDDRAHAPALPTDAMYGNRFGPKKAEALDRFGGSSETEAAVAAGLRYLARVQNVDGSWGDTNRTQPKYGEVFVGKTGLCLLAFLGAGHTPSSATEYSRVTRKAVEFLLATQDERTGHFGVTSSYSNGITTYALAECLALTKDESLKPPLTRAVRWILEQQSTSRNVRNRGGWGYYSPRLRAEDSYARASVTAWQVMALESAKLSGLDVPDAALVAARDFLLNCHDRKNGYFLYNHEPNRLASAWRTLPASTPAAVFCLLLLGVPAKDSRLQDGLRFTLERAPKDYRKVSDEEFVMEAAGNTYFWYYGSLACFLAGGETWEKWNRALKDVLPKAQEEDGSFMPIDPYARYADDRDGDRSYTTAMCVLSLEVYYRYFTPLLDRR